MSVKLLSVARRLCVHSYRLVFCAFGLVCVRQKGRVIGSLTDVGGEGRGSAGMYVRVCGDGDRADF